MFGKELQHDFYNNSQFFWRKVKGGAKQERMVLKGRDGELLEDGEKVAEWCREYFERLYNDGFRDGESEERMIEVSENEQEVDEGEFCCEPTKAEVKRCIARLKSGKAAGCSGIVAEMMKAGGEVVEEWLLRLFRRI